MSDHSTRAEEKLYCSISEVAQMTGLEAYVLRFWEKEFPTLRPRKSRSGARMYQRRDIDLVNRIKTLLYTENYTIEGARSRLRAHDAAEDPDILAENLRLKETLARVSREIDHLLTALP